MNPLTLTNPVFATYDICAALAVLKVMGQGWMTVYRLMKVGGGYARGSEQRAPQFHPGPGQLGKTMYLGLHRSAGHRNYMRENRAGMAKWDEFVRGVLFNSPPGQCITRPASLATEGEPRTSAVTEFLRS